MAKLIKGLIIAGCCIFVLQIAIFVSQIASARSSIEANRSSMIQSVINDTARLHEFSQTPEFRRLYLTRSKDSLEIFYNRYRSTPPRSYTRPIKTANDGPE